MNILERILEKKRAEVTAGRNAVPLSAMTERAFAQPAARDWEAALRGGSCTALIAEVKRASPSKGLLNADFDPVNQARAYADYGASAISVLTERNFFLADPDDLGRIHDQVPVPVLRKDFLYDPWQIAESRAMGADAVLLIAAMLDTDALSELLSETERLGLGYLLEIHDEADLKKALAVPATVIGINNRNLATFEVSLETTRELASAVRAERPDTVIVSESGLFNAQDVAEVAGWGADAVLIGEALMTSADVPSRVRELSGVSRFTR